MDDPDLQQENERLRARVAELEAALNTEQRTIEAVFQLPARLSALLALLVSVPIATEQTITTTVRSKTRPKVQVWRLRQAVLPYGIEIKSNRNVGWYLTDHSKEIITNALESGTPPPKLRTSVPLSGTEVRT